MKYSVGALMLMCGALACLSQTSEPAANPKSIEDLTVQAMVLIKTGRADAAPPLLKQALDCPMDSARLGVDHVLAVQALKACDPSMARPILDQFLAKFQSRILSAGASDEIDMDFSVYQRACKAFEEPERVTALYEQLKARGSVHLEGVKLHLFEHFVETGRLAEVEDLATMETWDRAVYTEKRSVLEYQSGNMDKEEVSRMKQSVRANMLEMGCLVYRAMEGLGKDRDAAQLRARITAHDPRAKVKGDVARAGLLSGKPTNADLALAKTVYESTRGADLQLVDTYARLLNHFGQNSAARDIAAKAAPATEADRQMLAQLQEALATH